MNLAVHFINKTGARVRIYQPGGILHILEPALRWDKVDNLNTVVVMDDKMKFPPRQPDPKWIKQTEWVWEEADVYSIYAPFRTVIFLPGNKVKLRRRPHWQEPEMAWPVVTFLFKSQSMELQTMQLGLSTMAVSLPNKIPMRISVDPLSKNAPYENYFFDEQLVLKDADPPFKNMKEVYESTEYGGRKRPADELQKIAELKEKDEERRLLLI
jgi:hypothetical protein